MFLVLNNYVIGQNFYGHAITFQGAFNCQYGYTLQVMDLSSGFQDEREVFPYCCFCDVDLISANVDYENCDNDSIDIHYEFNKNGNNNSFGVNGYTVVLNNQSFQKSLSDPRTIRVAGCQAAAFLNIFDTNDPDCSSSLNLSNVCCECNVTNQSYDLFDCNEYVFSAQFHINITGKCLDDDYSLTINGQPHAFIRDALNLFFVENISSEYTTLNFEFCSLVDESFCVAFDVINPCPTIANSECEITSFQINNSYQCIGDSAVLSFNFIANENFGTQGYFVERNNQSKYFSSITDDRELTYWADCSTTTEVKIIDALDSLCFAEYSLPVLCCDCTLDTVIVNVSSCLDSMVTLYFNPNTSGNCADTQWELLLGGDTLSLDYNGNSWYIDSIQSVDSTIIFALFADSIIVLVDTINNPCYNLPEPDTTCAISYFNVMPNTSCIGAFVGASFQFEGNYFGVNGYTITAGLNQFSFEDNDLHTLNVPGNCENATIFTITDSINPSCTLTDTLNICCPCSYDSIDVFIENCLDNEQVNLTLVFSNLNGSCALGPWTATVNGVTYDLWLSDGGYYFYNGIDATDSLMTITFCNETDIDTCFTVTIENSCYGDLSGSKCIFKGQSLDLVEVDNGILMQFDLRANANCLNGYSCWVNGLFLGNYQLDSGALTMLLQNFNDNFIHYTICSFFEPFYCIEKTIVNPFYTSGIENNFSKDVKISRQDFGSFDVQNSTNQTLTIQLVDLMGRVVRSYTISGHDAINFKPNVAAGLYHIIIYDAIGNQKTDKIIIAY